MELLSDDNEVINNQHVKVIKPAVKDAPIAGASGSSKAMQPTSSIDFTKLSSLASHDIFIPYLVSDEQVNDLFDSGCSATIISPESAKHEDLSLTLVQGTIELGYQDLTMP